MNLRGQRRIATIVQGCREKVRKPMCKSTLKVATICDCEAEGREIVSLLRYFEPFYAPESKLRRGLIVET